MKRGWTRKTLAAVAAAALAALWLTGCGSSSDSKQETTGAAQTTAPALDTSASTAYPNGSLLVSGDTLQKSLGASNLVIVDARGSDAAYAAGHVPGAIHLKHAAFWNAGSGLKDTDVVAGLLGAAGIKRDATIVVYDDTTASWGAAGRIFWMLEYLGCTDVHVLNGGWDKWSADGRRTETAAVTLPAATFTPSVQGSRKSSADSIARRLHSPDFVVVDTRTDEEYSGWQLYNEARGGHIPGAVQLPYARLFNSDKTVPSAADLRTLLESKGITPDKEVTAHCTAGIRSGYAYFLLRLLGYERCSNYDTSIWEWAARSDLPMEKSPRFSTVVYPAWVKALIDYHAAGSTTAAPPEYPYDRSHKYVIFETQWGSFDDMAQGWADDAYLKGHIPGAVHSNSDIYENGYPRWFLNSDAEVQATVGAMGVTADTTVVVYSDSPIFAARLWWILKYAGVTDVRFLNGGYEAWKGAGYAGETTVRSPTAATFAGTVRPELRATTSYVLAHYDTGDAVIADVRSAGEYSGVISGYGYLDAKGRIPGAVWAYDADDASIYYKDPDGTLRSYPEIASLWDGLGIDFAKSTTFYCGGGYRSSLAFLYAYLLGHDNVLNYSDGWEAWSTTYTDLGGGEWRQDPSGRPYETDWPNP